MRLIDADRLIQNFKDDSIGYELSDILSFVAIEDTIDKQPTVPAFGQWISVKDRPPRRGREVLVYSYAGETEKCRVYKDPISKFTGYTGENENTLVFDVTHWMPLPEPPKEGENE